MSRVWKVLAFAVAAAVLVTGIAVWLAAPERRASPDDTASYLLNERASLMDIGMLRLRRHLERVFQREGIWDVGISYKKNENRIYIVGWHSKRDGFERNDAEPLCREGLARLRDELGVANSKAKMDGVTWAGRAFASEADDYHSAIPLAQKVDQLVYVKSVVSLKSHGVLECTGKLVSDEAVPTVVMFRR